MSASRFEIDFAGLARAIDNALVASHALRAALKPGHPPFDAPLDEGVRRYGDGPVFALWAELRALHALSLAWSGKGFHFVEAPAIDEPDEALGLEVPAGESTTQQRLAG